MSIFVSMLPFGKNDLGVVIRDTSLGDAWLENTIEPAANNGIAQITLDKNGEYAIHGELMSSMPHGCLYDNDFKVLEWHLTDESCLSMTAFTHNQVNVFANLKLKECSIKASGPLFMAGTYECESSLVLEAEAVCLAGPVLSEGSVSLYARLGAGVFAPVTAKNMSIKAVYALQKAALTITGRLDISAQCFRQEAAGKTVVDTLGVIAMQCEVFGDMAVHENCVLTADTMVVGHEQSETTLTLNGNHCIRAGNLHIKGDTQIRVGGADSGKESKFIVGEKLLLDSPSMVDVYNTTISINTVENQGDLSFNQCMAEVKIMRQSGVFDACQSRLTVLEYLAHYDFSLTEVKDTDFSAKSLYVCGGKFIVSNCHYEGDYCHVFAGLLTVTNTPETALNNFFLAEKGYVNIQGGMVSVSQSIVSEGELLFDSTHVKAKHIKTMAGRAIIRQSTIAAQTHIVLTGVSELTNSRLSSNLVVLRGVLKADTLQLHAKIVEMMLDKAAISALTSFSEKLHLKGSKTSEQVVLKGCVLTSSRLSFSEHATIERSAIFGVSSKPVSHNIKAHLKLVSSRFITKNLLDNHADSELKLKAHSQLSVGLLHAKGVITAKSSMIHCDHILQKRAVITLKSSRAQVEHSVVLQESQMALKKNTRVWAPEVHLQQGSMLGLKKKCHLDTHSLLSTSSDSTIKSEASEIVAQKFISSGHTELSSSTLTAVKLFIDNAFKARQQSKITVEKRMLAARRAVAQFSDSRITSACIETFGGVITRHATVTVRKTVAIWSPGAMMLGEGTLVAARDMVFRGRLATMNKKISTEQEGEELPLISVLNVHRELLVTQNALIHGSADVLIDANRYFHLGTVMLGAHLSVKGGMLYNSGTIASEHIHLGFDDKVINSGKFSARNMEIQGNFLNLAGSVYAGKSLIMQGFYGVNLGLIVADNYTNTLLFSIQSGLVLSSSLLNPDSFLSWESYFLAGNALIRMMLPQYTDLINLMVLLPELLHHASSLYHMYKDVDLEHCKTMRLHEWMSKISHLTEAFGLFHHVFHAAVTLFGAHHGSVTERQGISAWRRFAADIIDAFSNEHITASLVDIHAGISQAPSVIKEALFSVNTGVEVSLIEYFAEGESHVPASETPPSAPHSGHAFFRPAQPAAVVESRLSALESNPGKQGFLQSRKPSFA